MRFGASTWVWSFPFDPEQLRALKPDLYGVFADGSIYGHLAITLYETFTGFFIGAIFGIGFGFALGRREVLAHCAAKGTLVFPGHVGAPFAGHVEVTPAGGGFNDRATMRA